MAAVSKVVGHRGPAIRPATGVVVVLLLVVMAALAPASDARRARLGTVYAGPIARKFPMVLKLTRSGRLSSVVLSARAKCDDGDSYHYAQQAGFADKVPALQIGKLTLKGTHLAKTGKFKVDGIDNEPSNNGDSVAIVVALKGKVTGSKAVGTLDVKVIALDPSGTQKYSCDSGSLGWSLASSKGRIFGGVTSQNTAVEVKLAPDGSQVDTFAIEWGTLCAPSGGAIGGPTALFGMPINAGAFDKTTTQTAGADGSPDATATLAGTIAGRAASGTFELNATFRDASGAATDTCATGSMSWSAASS